MTLTPCFGTEDVLEAVRRHPEAVDAVQCGKQPKAILASEMLAFCSLCLEQGVETVIESGRAYGYSTRTLARFFNVLSIESHAVLASDRHVLEECGDRVRLFDGDGLKMVPWLLKRSDKRTALLLDGPKGVKAIDLGLSLREQVVLFAVHDVYPLGERGVLNDAHPHAVAHGAWITQQPEFIEAWGHMDETWWQGTYSSRDELTSKGYHLGIFAGGQWRV